MACSYKWVTICAELFTIAIWMDVPNSHLPLGSLRGWLLATGEGRQKSTAKSGLASKSAQHLDALPQSRRLVVRAHSGTHSGSSQLTDSDKVGSCSRLMARPRYTMVWHGASNDVCGMSVEEAMWSVAVGEAMRWTILVLAQSLPPDTQT